MFPQNIIGDQRRWPRSFACTASLSRSAPSLRWRGALLMQPNRQAQITGISLPSYSGITSRVAFVELRIVLYNHAELRVRDRDLLLAPCGHSRARTALANPVYPKHFPPRTNQFRANQAVGPCALTIRRRALQSHGACMPPSSVPPGRMPSATQCGSEAPVHEFGDIRR
jgi:hypothetical protein